MKAGDLVKPRESNQILKLVKKDTGVESDSQIWWCVRTLDTLDTDWYREDELEYVAEPTEQPFIEAVQGWEEYFAR